MGMKAVLDANVLFPTILRELLADAADAGLYQPLWTERLLAEWVHAAQRLGRDQHQRAGAEAALLRLRFPRAMVAADHEVGLNIDLPDAGDLHVVQAALDAGADLIVTMNLRDFPTKTLARLGLRVQHPDEFLTGFVRDHRDIMARTVQDTLARAHAAGGDLTRRDMLRRARLPRFNKALLRHDGQPVGGARD